MSSLSEVKEIRQYVRLQLEKDRSEGIKFAIVGRTGYGKTSTVNALFNVNMKVDPVQRATISINEVNLIVRNAQRFPREPRRDVALQVYDLPGLYDGYAPEKDEQDHFQTYLHLLPFVDVVLWIFKADNRDYEVDIQAMKRVLEHTPELRKRLVVGINAIDKIEPNDWSRAYNRPSKEQRINLKRRLEDVLQLVHNKLELDYANLAFYSADRAYGLENLFLCLIQACPEEKRWIFAELHVDYSEKYLSYVHPSARAEVMQLMKAIQE